MYSKWDKLFNKRTIVTECEISPFVNIAGFLLVGFKWQRQLLFRSKLTMHTAFERDDNKEPAAITAIAVSK